ncbi:MAG: hypothetical protein CVU41_12070 [Chloroflexi bacterium HGW-Chloroflexi-3]|nr:MAG: hypothetical protein CVU41_12070 [Chloroflexi bacterium HGW-Chloroflexi-3]
MNKKSSSPLFTLILGTFWIILTINTTFNWGSNGTLIFWLVFTILIGWFVIAIQNRMRRA